MENDGRTLVVLGGTGFVGSYVVAEALAAGWTVKALARSATSAQSLRSAGAAAFTGAADNPHQWIHEAYGAAAIIDLVQPKFPKRVGSRQLQEISAQRQRFTAALVAALASIPPEHRPVLISVSGIDDLAPDNTGYISAQSSLRTRRYGLNPIGIPVRNLIERSGIGAAFVYLPTVYGPGKAFTEAFFPSIAAGTWKNFGHRDDRIQLIHVEDAARELVAVAGSPLARIVGTSFVFTDNSPVAVNAFFDFAASLMGVSVPGRIPQWLAALVVGRPLVEVMIYNDPVRPSNSETFMQFKYPSFREGLPATLKSLGMAK